MRTLIYLNKQKQIKSLDLESIQYQYVTEPFIPLALFTMGQMFISKTELNGIDLTSPLSSFLLYMKSFSFDIDEAEFLAPYQKYNFSAFGTFYDENNNSSTIFNYLQSMDGILPSIRQSLELIEENTRR